MDGTNPSLLNKGQDGKHGSRTWRNLRQVQIQRHFIPDNIGPIKKLEPHHFSDASKTGCGQCSHTWIVTERKVHCTLVMGKARVAPTKVVTVPYLELIADIVSAAVSNFLREFFWIDSQWIHVFVANCIQKITNSTDPGQWFYIKTDQNPADHASRGLTVAELMKSNWFTRPKFKDALNSSSETKRWGFWKLHSLKEKTSWIDCQDFQTGTEP